MSRDEMNEALLETIRQNDLRDGYIRLIVTRGVGNLGLNPAQCKRPSVIIIATTIALYPEEVYENGLTVVTVRDAAHGPGALNPAVKSLNYLNNVMARIEANLAGADEALMLNDAGNVAECTADNVFVIKRGQIFTPPITAGALRGITRSVVFDIAAELGIKITETEITRHDVFIADECFPHRHGGGSHSGDQGGRAHDRNRKTGRDHDANDRALPRIDARNGHADFFLNVRADAQSAQKVLSRWLRVECFRRI